jgi:hypothetical protein
MRRVTERGPRPATYQSEYYTEDVYGHHNEARGLGIDMPAS